ATYQFLPTASRGSQRQMGDAMGKPDRRRAKQARPKRRPLGRAEQDVSRDCRCDGEAVERAYRDGVAHGEAMRRDGGLCYGTYAERIAFRNGWMRGVKNRYAT